MRQIGSIPQQAQAERFTAYLITQGIAVQAEAEDDTWLIWVRDEDQLEAAREALQDFLENPDEPQYRNSVRQANAKLQKEAQRREQTRRQTVSMGDRWRKQQAGNTPLVNAIIGLCIVVFLLTNFNQQSTIAYRTLAFCDPIHERDPDWNPADWQERAIDIQNGEVWRIITPAFMHGSIMHMAFNLYMFHMFGTQIERRRGALRLALLILGIAAVSNLAQGLAPMDWGQLSGTYRFVGFSGVVYGLLGYLWMKTVHEPHSGMFVSSGTVVFLTVFMLLGFAGVLESFGMHIANLAHGVGMLTGMAFGYLPVLLRSNAK